MRELKFRAWDTAFKRYAGYEFETLLVNPNGFGSYGDRYIWEQYTGLNDKNGKEIFEGDIVKRFKLHEFLKDVTETEVFRIRWGVRKAGFFAYNKARKKHSQPAKRLNANDIYEVIGNIHENPELLGGTNATNKEAE